MDLDPLPRPRAPGLGLLLAASTLASGVSAAEPAKVVRSRQRLAAWLAQHQLAAIPEGLEIHVEKAARKLTVVAGGRELFACPVGLGGAPVGHKQREGDLRTPEGRYYVCTRNVRSRFHLFLGVSYPGPADADAGLAEGRITQTEHRAVHDAHRRVARPPWKTALGGEIGIHGYGAGADWTLGCVAVDDEHIELLWALAPLGTPVVIRP